MHFSSFTTPGSREQNEDSIYPEPGQAVSGLFIVADGLGGHADGKIASELACSTMRQIIESEDPASFVLGGHRMGEQELMEAFLSDAVRQAGAAVRHTARQRSSDMGSTLLAVLLKDGHGYCAHIGDCALFVSEKGENPPTKLTSEHRRGASLTRSLGAQEQVTPDVLSFEFGEDSLLVMGCDGFWESVPVDRIGQLAAGIPPLWMAEELAQAALDAGSQDNVSVIVVAGDGFVRKNAANQVETYSGVLAGRADTPERLARQQAVAEFRAHVAKAPGDISAAPAHELERLQKVAILEQECQTLRLEVAELEKSLRQEQEQARQIAALPIPGADTESEELQKKIAHQDFVIRDLEAQVKAIQEQTNAVLGKELETERRQIGQKVEAYIAQLQDQQKQIKSLETEKMALLIIQQKEKELEAYCRQMLQTLKEKENQVRELEQKLQVASYLAGETLPSRTFSEPITGIADLQIKVKHNYDQALSYRKKAIVFGEYLLKLNELNPALVEAVLKTSNYCKPLKAWIESQKNYPPDLKQP
jgi:serine/threonine protein phosphatase PrpC